MTLPALILFRGLKIGVHYKFFDSVDHEWLLRMIAHRIADSRVLRLIHLWLKAGVLESGEWHETVEKTPQGAGISPPLANIFLHYALDLGGHQWRKRQAPGPVIIVRYADDFVMSLQRTQDARRMLADLRGRLAKFTLGLHEEKNPADRIRSASCPGAPKTGRAAARDVRFPGIHALRGLDPGRTFCGEAEDAEQATDGQAEVAADGSSAPDASGGVRSAPMALPSAAGALPVLQSAEQLPLPEGVLSASAAHLVPRLAAPEPTSDELGRLWRRAPTLSFAHPCVA
jgi:hypothetical protein